MILLEITILLMLGFCMVYMIWWSVVMHKMVQGLYHREEKMAKMIAREMSNLRARS